MNDVLTSMDRTIIRKLLSTPPEPLSEEETERYRYGDGLVYRLTRSWDSQNDAIQAIVALQTVSELQTLVPRMVAAFDRLVALEENRERREEAAHAAALEANKVRMAGLWGKNGAVAGIIGVAAALAGALGGWMAGSTGP